MSVYGHKHETSSVIVKRSIDLATHIDRIVIQPIYFRSFPHLPVSVDVYYVLSVSPRYVVYKVDYQQDAV